GGGNGFIPSSPTSLATALTYINDAVTYPGLNTIRFLSSTYTVAGRIDIPANTLFDGGYESVIGAGCDATETWRKNTSLATVLNITPVLETPTVSATLIGVYRGFAAASVNNWRLQDLTINVLTAGAAGQTNNRGRSIYGVYVDNCTGYEITRCQITTGAASAG